MKLQKLTKFQFPTKLADSFLGAAMKQIQMCPENVNNQMIVGNIGRTMPPTKKTYLK